MTGQDTLVLRVDAGGAAGLGHLTRCTALAETWSLRGGGVVFVTAGAPDAIVATLESRRFRVDRVPEGAPAAVLLERVEPYPGAWIVFDGYSFTTVDHACVHQAGHPVLVIDDLAQLDRYDVDVVLNQNVHAGDLRYTTAPDTKVLLGTGYALLRREFLDYRADATPRTGRGRRILVTLGGSDRFNQTAKVLQGLSLLNSPFEATVVAGAANAHATALADEARRQGAHVHVVTHPPSMPELMASSDIAVSAAGSTSWELAFMGVPTVAITLSDNQRAVAAKLDAMGVCRALGWRDDVTPAMVASAVDALLNDETARRAMSSRGRELVDGRGADRVIDVMRKPRPQVAVPTARAEHREAR